MGPEHLHQTTTGETEGPDRAETHPRTGQVHGRETQRQVRKTWIVSLPASWREMLNRFVSSFHSLINESVWFVSTQRLEEARELSSWSQLRRSTWRYLKRLKDDGQEWLSSLKLWRGDIHLIEGERWKSSDISWFLLRIAKYEIIDFAPTGSSPIIVANLIFPSFLSYIL